MVPIPEAAMTVALDRVRWALSYPRRHGQDDWDGRLRRALTALQKAWKVHGDLAEALIAEQTDPRELPFTDAARQAAELRREHHELGKESQRLCQALRRTPSVYQSSYGAVGSGRARQRLGALLRRAEALVEAVHRHLATESALEWEEPHQLAAGPANSG